MVRSTPLLNRFVFFSAIGLLALAAALGSGCGARQSKQPSVEIPVARNTPATPEVTPSSAGSPVTVVPPGKVAPANPGLGAIPHPVSPVTQ